jgi:dephospho-CoA kinase
MKIISIVGKSGSGKSLVSNLLAKELDCEHIALDEVSHEVLSLESYTKFVENEFGTDVFDDGKINRKKLGQIVFSNPEKLKKLNQTAEILMEEIIDKKIATSRAKFIILDYALLPEMKYFKMSDAVIFVCCDDQTRMERVMMRENVSKEYFLLRDSKITCYQNIKYDFLIENNFHSESDLSEKIKNIANQIRKGENNHA